MLLEQGRDAGGHLLGEASGALRYRAVARRARGPGTCGSSPETAAFGVFGGGLVAAAGRHALYRIRARHVIFATGAVEGSAVFPGNDLPGVMVSSGVHLLLHRYGVLPGRRAVVLTGDNVGYATAWALKDAGAEVTVVDLRSEGGWPEGFPVFAGSTILSAHGRRRVSGVSVGPPGATSGQKVACDLVVNACVQTPSTNLLAQAGARLAFDEALAGVPPGGDAGAHVGGRGGGGSALPGGRRGAGQARRARGRGRVGTRGRRGRRSRGSGAMRR